MSSFVERATRPSGNGKKTTERKTDIYMDIKANEVVRLTPDFAETMMIWTGNNSGYKKGSPSVFRKDLLEQKLVPTQTICSDWDIATATYDKKGCPLREISDAIYLTDQYNLLTKVYDEKSDDHARNRKLYDVIKPQKSVFWQVYSRAHPTVLLIKEDGSKVAVLGRKIVNLGNKQFEELKKIYNMLEFDITSPEEGCDVTLTVASVGGKNEYGAAPVMSKGMVVRSPFTAEEAAIEPYDLEALKFKYHRLPREKIIEALNPEFAEFLDINVDALRTEVYDLRKKAKGK